VSEEIDHLCKDLFSSAELVKRMLLDQYANYVLQKLIEKANCTHKAQVYEYLLYSPHLT
jgi:hypothetical protein